MLDHDPVSLQLISRSFDGVPEGLSPDDILDNITHYWLTNTAISAARLYWELLQEGQGFFDVRNVSIPVAVSVFPDEAYQAPRSWTERAYPKLIYYNKLDKGGRFPAWEQPQLFSEEVRAGFNLFANSGAEDVLYFEGLAEDEVMDSRNFFQQITLSSNCISRKGS